MLEHRLLQRVVALAQRLGERVGRLLRRLVVVPMRTDEPTRTGVDSVMRLPSTNVPFVEPRSCTTHWSRQRTIFAWLFEV